jgi:hypothetical protein
MHALRLHKCRTRQLVWSMLAAWVFAWAAGVANACVFNVVSAPAGPDSVAPRATDGHHPGLTAAHEHPQDNGRDACLKFCDDESSALSKTTTYGADLPVALVDARESRGATVPVMRVDNGLSPQRPVAQGPPLVIRFLRLTL